MTDPTPQAQPGWYPISAGSSQLRWWDGTKWTEHTHDTAAAVAYAPQQPLKAPVGTRPYTVWIWILAIIPLAALPALATENFSQIMRLSVQNSQDPTAIYRSTGYLTSLLISLVVYVVSVLLSVLDYRQLSRAGIPAPFHWAWSFLNSGVYVIGRSVIARRRIGSGLAPLWVWIAVVVVVSVVSLVVVFNAVASVLPQYPVGG